MRMCSTGVCARGILGQKLNSLCVGSMKREGLVVHMFITVTVKCPKYHMSLLSCVLGSQSYFVFKMFASVLDLDLIFTESISRY